MSAAAPLFPIAPAAPVQPAEIAVLAAIPTSGAIDYYRLVNNRPPLGQRDAQRALLALVMSGAAHAYSDPQMPSGTAVVRGPYPRLWWSR